jgi:hypothetical protein
MLSNCEYEQSESQKKQTAPGLKRWTPTRAEIIPQSNWEPPGKNDLPSVEPLESKCYKARATPDKVGTFDPLEIYHTKIDPLKPWYQNRVAKAMLRELTRGSDSSACDTTAAIVSNAFAIGLQDNKISRFLMRACITLAQACKHYEKIDIFVPILKLIVSYGPLDEDSFYGLEAPAVVSKLLYESGFGSQHLVTPDVKKLDEAVAIFLTEFRGGPPVYPPKMRDLGNKLCEATFLAQLYKLTPKIYWRMSDSRGDEPLTNTGILILASHRTGSHEKVLRYFTDIFAQTQPDKDQFYDVTSAALSSALELNLLNEAEKIVHVATEMASRCNFHVLTIWFLKILGHHWRTTRELPETEALLGRLETLTLRADRPQRLYSAMLQFSVESGNDNEAQKYFKRFVVLNRGVSVRVLGHLALAKAMKNDWEGVEANFRAMSNIANNAPSSNKASIVAIIVATFAPILKLFAKSHDISQIEDFVRLFIVKYGVVPNHCVSNIMIDKYFKVGEIDCIPKWMEYVSQLGVGIDSVTLNSILTTLRYKWKASFIQLYRIYRTIQSTSSYMFDQKTIAILRRAANEDSDGWSGRGWYLSRVRRPAVHNVFDKIKSAIGRGMPDKALLIYERALQAKQLLSPEVISAAVTACVQYYGNGNLEPAKRLVEDAQSRGFNVAPSLSQLLLYRLQSIEGDTEDVEAAVEHTVASLTSLQKRGLEIPTILATETASKLMERRGSQLSMKFGVAISKLINNQSFRRFDIAFLTALLRAHIAAADCTGIQWIMDTIARNGVHPDKRFKETLKNGRRQARQRLEARPEDSAAKLRYNVLDASMQHVAALRRQSRPRTKKITRMLQAAAERSRNDGIVDRDVDRGAHAINSEARFRGPSQSFQSRL